jgi:Right handed beta helix region
VNRRATSAIALATASILLALLSLVARGAGTTYYVDATAGSDANDGLTATKAWRMLAKVNAVLQPGDTAQLVGTFSGQPIRPARSGTAGQAITYQGPAELRGGTLAVDLTDRSFVALRDLTIRDIATGGSWGAAVKIARGSDNLIEGCTIERVGAATADRGDAIWIEDGSHRNRIVRNQLRSASHALIQVGGDRAGQAEVGDTVITDNLIANPWGTGIGLLHRARRALVERNVITEVNQAGTNATAATIQIASSGHVIRRNVIMNNATKALSLFAYTYAAGVEQDAIGNQITHNTFVGNGPILIFEKHGRSVRDNLFANNILVRAGGPHVLEIEHYHSPTSWPVGNLNGNQFLNNLFRVGVGAASVLRIRNTSQGGNLTYALPQFETVHATGAWGNREGDPLFTNQAAGDFTLRVGSPAIDAGRLLADVGYLGTAPDLGAFETVGLAKPAAPVAVQHCWFSISAAPPDATTGWTMWLHDGGEDLGVLSSPPYQRVVALAAGRHEITARWGKPELPWQVSAPTAVTCP